MRCPDLTCKSGLCRKCYDHAVGDNLVFIRPPTVDDGNGISDADGFTSDCGDSNTSSYSIEPEWLEDSEELQGCQVEAEDTAGEQGIIMPIENDDIDDFVVTGGNDDIPGDIVDPGYFPTALAGDKEFLVEEDIPKGRYVSGYVIMNQCGSLLNRNDRDIIGYLSQKYFLQRIASITDGETLPFIYPVLKLIGDEPRA